FFACSNWAPSVLPISKIELIIIFILFISLIVNFIASSYSLFSLGFLSISSFLSFITARGVLSSCAIPMYNSFLNLRYVLIRFVKEFIEFASVVNSVGRFFVSICDKEFSSIFDNFLFISTIGFKRDLATTKE